MQTQNNQSASNLNQVPQISPIIQETTPVTNPQPKLSDKKPPTLIFTLMTLTNILINLDHGILPACIDQMRTNFHMDQTQLGFLGSIVYLGIVLTGTLAGHLYLRFVSKQLTLIALLLLQASLLLMVATQELPKQTWIPYVSRFLTGSFQVFLLVYYPVWIDKFGCNKKTLWLTILQICVPLGIFTGYGLTAAIINFGYNFYLSFEIQIVAVFIFLFAFIFIPEKQLDCRRNTQKYQQTFMDSIPIMRSNFVNSQIVGPNTLELLSQQKRKNTKMKYNYFVMMKKLLKSKMYIVATLTMAVILFVSTGIQFWLTDYFINVIGQDAYKVYIAYAVVSVTGPTSGCGFGGVIISKRGGYDNPTTVYVVFIFAAIGIGCAVIIPFIRNFYIICVLLWLVLFFGGGMMPGLTGMMMVSVPPYLRAFGNSNGQIIKNVLGYLPAPFLYGWFNSMFNNQSAGIKLVMFWGLFAPFILLLGSVYRYWELKKQTFGDNNKKLFSPILEQQGFESHVQNLKENPSFQCKINGKQKPKQKPHQQCVQPQQNNHKSNGYGSKFINATQSHEQISQKQQLSQVI